MRFRLCLIMKCRYQSHGAQGQWHGVAQGSKRSELKIASRLGQLSETQMIRVICKLHIEVYLLFRSVFITCLLEFRACILSRNLKTFLF